MREKEATVKVFEGAFGVAVYLGERAKLGDVLFDAHVLCLIPGIAQRHQHQRG